MKSEEINTLEQALKIFTDFAIRTNWFDNETAKSNIPIFIKEVWNSSRSTTLQEVREKAEGMKIADIKENWYNGKLHEGDIEHNQTLSDLINELN